jgi:hypothetical protein
VPLSTEIVAAVRGAFRLALWDRAGYADFNPTIEGFWRSFLAAAVIAPLLLIAVPINLELIAALPGAAPAAPRDGANLSALFAHAVETAAYPLALVFITRALSLGHRYVPYIIAYNWSAVPIMVAILAPLLLYRLGAISAGVTVVLSAVVALGSLANRWFIARSALGISGLLAAALVLGDLVLNLAIHRLFD